MTEPVIAYLLYSMSQSMFMIYVLCSWMTPPPHITDNNNNSVCVY